MPLSIVFSFILMEETRVSEKTFDLLQVTDKLEHNVVSSTDMSSNEQEIVLTTLAVIVNSTTI